MKRVVSFRKQSHESEWLGGRYTLPTEVRDGDATFPPDVLLWLELPSGAIVGSKLVHPREPSSLAQSFRETVREPHAGSGLPPARIRVADERAAAELRAAAEGIPVLVAPVPELDAAVADLMHAVEDSAPEPSYLGDGDLDPRLIGELFEAAGLLFRTAPWRRMSDQQIPRVDVPRFGIDGACLSVIGAAGESFGLMLFDSFDDFNGFIEAAAERARSGREPAGRQGGEVTLRSLSFDRKEDLPASMLREIEQYRWPVAGPGAYPVAFSLDAGLSPRPVTGDDIRILTAVARAFVAFFERHGGLFSLDDPEPVCETSAGEDGVEVTITAPYAIFEDDAPAHPVSRREVGRNDPCPCGSGKKYKKCHLDADQAPRRTAQETVHQMDYRLVREIARFAARRFGPDWLPLDPDDEHEDALQLLIPWVTWTAAVDAQNVAGAYRDEHASRLSAEEREWIEAQRAAWLSVWEVTGVEPGRVDVRDLLTGETRSVREEAGSRTVVPRDALLTRVVDYRGRSYFGGMYARPLPPAAAAAVIGTVRHALRRRKTAVPPERLRDPKIGWHLIDHWSKEVAREDERRTSPLILQNTDGDPLLFITDSYTFDAARRPDVEKALATLEGLDSARAEENERVHVFVRPADDTVIGRVAVGPGTLRIDTNSENRAAALAGRVENACAGMLRKEARRVQAPPAFVPGAAPSGEPPPKPGPEEQALLREYKERHYSKWLDTPLPALGGKTPRAAARSARSRAQLDLLLRDIENRESRLPQAARFDMTRVRRELGLEP